MRKSGQHDLRHALTPLEAGCECDMSQIHSCVICEKRLKHDREQVDTCGRVCEKELLRHQRTMRRYKK